MTVESAQQFRELSADELDLVGGGFVCGGLCVVGLAFAAGVIFGAGVAVGVTAAEKSQ